MPIFIDLQKQPVLLVGAGRVALRRASLLLKANAQLVVIAPQIDAGFTKLQDVELQQRAVKETDIDQHWRLVVTASNQPEVNAMVSRQCQRLGVLCNRCDAFEQGSFICGATSSQGSIISAVVSGGVPEMARYLDQKFKKLMTPALIELTALLAEVRPLLKAARPHETANLLASVVNEATIARVEREGIESLRQEILAWL